MAMKKMRTHVIMPMVDGKKFAYTAKGKKMAKAAADKKKKKKMPMKKMRTM
jgi:hypothetical protein